MHSLYKDLINLLANLINVGSVVRVYLYLYILLCNIALNKVIEILALEVMYIELSELLFPRGPKRPNVKDLFLL